MWNWLKKRTNKSRPRIYICENCGGHFVTSISDTQARKEAEERRVAPVGPENTEEELSVICAGCYPDFIQWAEESGLATTSLQ